MENFLKRRRKTSYSLPNLEQKDVKSLQGKQNQRSKLQTGQPEISDGDKTMHVYCLSGGLW